MPYAIDRVNEKLKNGQTILGSHVFCGAPMLTEAMAQQGFDFIWVDMEHTAIGKAEVLQNLIAVRAGGACSLVRIPWNDPVLAKPIIDMGPDAILFPYIRTAEDARLAVASCAYPPSGIRGYGPLRALDYGAIPQMEYVTDTYKKMWRVIQIEHVDAVRNLDAILQVEGVDAYIVGPNDLSASAGLIGRVTAPQMMPLYDEIAQKMNRAGKVFGVSMGFVPEVLNQWIDRGARILFAGHDSGYVQQGAHDVLMGLNALVG